MWLYIPREYCPCSPELLDSISEFGLFFQSQELFVTLSGKATQRPYSWRGWKTRPWMKLLSGVTLQPSTQAAGMELWIQSVLASRASQSQSQANEPESRKGHDQDSSLKPAELFAKYQASGIFLSKTSQDCFLTDSCQSYSESFPKWGSMRSGECFRQEMWAAPILEKESSSWPTPAMRDYKGANNCENIQKKLAEGHRGFMGQLANAVNHTGPMAPAKQSNGSDSSKSAQTSPQPLKKRLNPKFVEHLMGMPLGWSLPIPIDQNDYKRWETESARLLRLLHSACYGNE